MQNSRKSLTNAAQKIIVAVLALTVVFGPLFSTGAAAQPALPPDPAQKQTAVETEHETPIQYKIQAKLHENNMTMKGIVDVTYRNTSKDVLSELVFHTFADANRSKSTQHQMFIRQNEEISKEHPEKKPEDFLGGIDIKGVMSQGNPLQYIHKNQSLTVPLERTLKAGETVSVQVEFDLKIPYGMQRISYYKDIINGAHWFPVLAVYDENKKQWNKTPYSTTFETDYYTSSDYEVEFNVPDSYQLAMPGTMTTRESTEKGRKIVSTTAPNIRKFTFFASPNFKVESVTRDGLTIEYFYLDSFPEKKKLVEEYIDQAFKAIQFFGEKYGKYPYPDFRIVETYVEGVALEHAGLIQMGQIHPKSAPARDYVFIHEIAHQWFHSLIGNNSETESFLDEGFADFSKVYFAEKQGDTLSGFKAIQFDDFPAERPIASTNKEVEGWESTVYYDKGRQAIYQLYRLVGEEKFDAFMKEYFKRYVHKNATIDGLLQTIGDTLGEKAKKEMKTALYQPDYVLKPEYQLTEQERTEFIREQFKEIYELTLSHHSDLPFETMSRVMERGLQGEPITLVLSDQVSKAVNAQQETLVLQLISLFDLTGIEYEIIEDRQELKKKLNKELGTSHLIVIGNAKSNALIQAMKPGIIQQASKIGLNWKDAMNKPKASGAYVIRHPHNQNRLLLHYFWNGEQLTDESFEPFITKMQDTLVLIDSFYQYYVMDKSGKIVADKKMENLLSEYFIVE